MKINPVQTNYYCDLSKFTIMNPNFLNYFSKKMLIIISIGIVLAILLSLFAIQNFNKDKKVLDLLWTNYKTQYIDRESGRAIDEQNNGITTSEGQSYNMLRAVIIDRKSTRLNSSHRNTSRMPSSA